jgi:hypothetical protein
MALFPTGSLRALARYNEAKDFETSNTIDAYDRALEMYRLSLDELKASWWHGWRIRIGQRWPRLVSWEWTGIRAAMESEAKIKLGYLILTIAEDNLHSVDRGSEPDLAIFDLRRSR